MLWILCISVFSLLILLDLFIHLESMYWVFDMIQKLFLALTAVKKKERVKDRSLFTPYLTWQTRAEEVITQVHLIATAITEQKNKQRVLLSKCREIKIWFERWGKAFLGWRCLEVDLELYAVLEGMLGQAGDEEFQEKEE